MHPETGWRFLLTDFTGDPDHSYRGPCNSTTPYFSSRPTVMVYSGKWHSESTLQLLSEPFIYFDASRLPAYIQAYIARLPFQQEAVIRFITFIKLLVSHFARRLIYHSKTSYQIKAN